MQKCVFGNYADNEDPDQTARMRSLIWVVTVRLQNHWILYDISTYSKGPYQSVWLLLLIRNFDVPISLSRKHIVLAATQLKKH